MREIVAHAGGPIEQRVVASAARLSSMAAAAPLHELRTDRLVLTHGARDRSSVEIYHSRLGPPVLATLDRQRACEMHARLGAALMELPTHDHERVAFHLREAGQHDQAVAHLLTGAKRAEDTLAHERAARLYGLALDSGVPAAQLFRVRVARAETLRKAGHNADAARAYLEAAQMVSEPAAEFELRRQAAQAFLLSGYLAEGRALMAELMPRVQLSLPAGRLQAIAGLLLRRIWLRIRGVAFKPRAEAQISAAELARVDTCWVLGQALVMVDPVLGNNLQSRHVLFALASGEPTRVARALALEAVCASYPGPTAARWVQRLLGSARMLSQATSQPLARVTTSLWGAATAYFMGEPERALREAAEAERGLRDECSGVAYELATCHLIVLGSYNMLGRWNEFGRRAREALVEAIARGNRYQSVGLRAHTHMACLVAGDVAGAAHEVETVRCEWPQGEMHMQHLAIFFGEARIRLYSGDGPGAYHHLQQMWPTVEGSMMLRARFLLVEALAWRGRAAALAYAQTRDASYQRAARHDARALGRQRFLGAAGTALMLRAALAVCDGERARARGSLKDAAAAYDQDDLPFFAALARYQAGVLGNDARARRLAAEGASAITAAGVRDCASFVQMFTGIPAARAETQAALEGEPIA